MNAPTKLYNSLVYIVSFNCKIKHYFSNRHKSYYIKVCVCGGGGGGG